RTLHSLPTRRSSDLKLEALGKQIAMHVAATKPLSLSSEDLDPEAVERERAVFSEQAKASGKPDNIVEKMVEGRIRKYYEEVTLQIGRHTSELQSREK